MDDETGYVEKQQCLQTSILIDHNKPIELWSMDVIEQKVHYIHENPVKAGFVLEADHWKYSSACDYTGHRGLVAIQLLW